MAGADMPFEAPALGAQYDLVSFDPRFFGLSTPLNCKWPTDLEAVSQIATPDRTAFDANVAAVKQLASLCAPYADALDPVTGMLTYEGHDEPQRQGGPNPKEVDQPLTTPRGSWTENGKFFRAAMDFKSGLRGSANTREE